MAYSFTAPAAGNYSFRVTNYSTSSDLVAHVANTCPSGPSPITIPDANCVGAANRTPSSSAEDASCLPLTSGQTVYAFTDENALTSGSSFRIEVNSCTLETEPNGTPATANAYTWDTTGSTTPAADADFFSLGTPAAGSRVFALADGVAANNHDFDMRITTDVDTLEYDDLNNDTPFGLFAPNVAGTPLTGVASTIRMNHFSATTQSQPYRLYAVVRPPSASAVAETEPNDTTAQANLHSSGYFGGALASTTDVDLFRFAASPGDLIFLSLDADPLRNNTPFNGALALLDASGNPVVSVNDGGSTSSTATGAGSLTATTPSSPGEGLTYRVPAAGTEGVKSPRPATTTCV